MAHPLSDPVPPVGRDEPIGGLDHDDRQPHVDSQSRVAHCTGSTVRFVHRIPCKLPSPIACVCCKYGLLVELAATGSFPKCEAMHTSTCKLTKRYQATIPEPVRTFLDLGAGDAIAFDIEGDEVRLRKARPIDLAFAQALQATLEEWSSEADEEAWRGL